MGKRLWRCKANPIVIFAMIFFGYFSSSVLSYAQLSTNYSDEFLDFSAVESYFLLGEKIEQNIEPTTEEWKRYFEAPINALMFSAGALDSTEFRSQLRRAYADPNISSKHIDVKGLQHHYKYKAHNEDLRRHIHFLKSSPVLDSIYIYLNPYLPKRLSRKEDIPRQYYVFYGSEDATGGIDMVINDLLLSYKVDNYRLGLLSAHESFHSIVTNAFANMLLTPDVESNANLDLLYFLSTISQEGIADLIDKPLLVRPGSPLKKETELMLEEELESATKYISKLDSILNITEGDFPHPFSVLFGNYCKNGGHIPGRLMGKAIEDCGLMQDLVPQIEDPILFIELYNKAVISCRLDLPRFSDKSIKYFVRLRQRYLKP